MESFVEYLESGLARKGLSRYALSKQLGASQTHLNRLANGKVTGGAGEESLRRVAAALELDPDRLVVLSGELFPEGSLRRRNSELLGEVVNLRAENEALRARLDGRNP
jgi:transcriptional regulator with XRE-family HTH domain